MKNKKMQMSLIVWAVSALFVAAAFGIFFLLLFAGDILPGIIIFTLTPIFGVLGLELGLRLIRKTFVPLRRRPLAVSVAAALGFGLVTSIGAQIVYAMGTVTSTKTIELPGEVERLNIVLALDKSDSMYTAAYDGPCADATCALVDGLSEEFYMKYISFSADIIGETDLLRMTDSNKEKVKEQIQTWVPGGGTNFNEPVRAALSAVSGAGGSSVIILVTDGRAELSDDLAERLRRKDDDISFYVLYISNSGAPEIAGIADEAFEVPQNAQGEIDVSKMLAALRSAVKETIREEVQTEEVFGFTNDVFTYPMDVKPHQALIMLAALIMYSIFVSWLYYGSVSDGRSLINIGVGIFVWAFSYLVPFGFGIGALVFYAVLSVPIVTFDVVEE